MTRQEVRYAAERHKTETQPHSPMHTQQMQEGTIPYEVTTTEEGTKEDRQISSHRHGEKNLHLILSAPSDELQ